MGMGLGGLSHAEISRAARAKAVHNMARFMGSLLGLADSIIGWPGGFAWLPQRRFFRRQVLRMNSFLDEKRVTGKFCGFVLNS
jgi:hypothetical protein